MLDIFRIFAIIYHRHFTTIEKLDAAAHLNTCFKHFMFFVLEFSLVVSFAIKNTSWRIVVICLMSFDANVSYCCLAVLYRVWFLLCFIFSLNQIDVFPFDANSFLRHRMRKR